MKNKKILIACGLILAFTSGVFADTTLTNIKVALNSVKIVVNGKTINQPNIVYNGVTYVPVNAVATELGNKVQWDKSTRTVTIGNKVSTDVKSIQQKPVSDVKPTQQKPVSDVKYPTVEEINFNFNFKEPDSIGIYYVEASYTNLSKFTIKSVTLKFLDANKNETYYLTSLNTVKPSETSPNFKTFAPENGKTGMQNLVLNIGFIDENGKEHSVDYDYKLNKYNLMY